MASPRRALRHARALSLLSALPLLVGLVWESSGCGDDDGASAPSPATEAGTPDAPNTSAADAAASTDGRAEGGDGGPVAAPYGFDTRPPNATCLAPARPPGLDPATLKLERRYENIDLTFAMMMAKPPGDKTRWFYAKLNGDIGSFAATAPASATIVASVPTLAGIPLGTSGESGLLGFAFHPSFQTNGRVYVSWNSADGPSGLRSRIGYITSPDGGATFTSYTNVLVFDQPGVYYHHGGGIAFGPDGLLYASFGDGGDPKNGSLKTSPFSKVLRIDVDATNLPAGKTYGIPPDNPFADGGLGEPATFAYGFRNPFRFQFDRGTGDLWLGDVGAAAYEEIDLVKRGGNYGWDCREGAHDNAFASDPAACAATPADRLDPIIDVPRDANPHAIVGGRVYRGAAIPALAGAYLYGDYSSGSVFVTTFDPKTAAPATTKLNAAGPVIYPSSFAEDEDGELYIVNLSNGIYQVVLDTPDGGAPLPSSFPDRLSKTGCDPRVVSWLIPYAPIAPAWNDGATAERWFALPDGATIDVLDDLPLPDGGAPPSAGSKLLALPPSSVVVETLSAGAKRIETRLLVRHADGDWAGYSYEWLDDQSDAVLLPSSKRKTLTAGAGAPATWYFPSRSECVQCHNAPAHRTLGLGLAELDRDFVYTATNRVSNQLATFEHAGLLTPNTPLPPLTQIDALADPYASGGSLEAKARAYLHASCAMCHRGATSAFAGKSDMDLRSSTSLAASRSCDVDAKTGDLDVGAAKLIKPGASAASQISIRPRALDARRMPPLASDVVDGVGASLLEAWITSLPACP